MRRALWVFALLAAHALSSAQASAAEPDLSGAAEDLFQRGKVLFVKRDFAAACPLFFESYRLDPAGGTLQNLAVCYEELGKWASAYARFQELRTISKGTRPDRVKLADEHIAKLAPRVSHVVITVPAELESTAAVTVDATAYLRPSWSAGIAVDPGGHDIVVSAPGKEPFRTTIETPRQGTQQHVRVPPLVDVPRPPPERAAPAAPRLPEEHAPLDTTGLVVGGIGAAALVAGGVFGVLAFTTNAAGKEKCTTMANRGPDYDPMTGRCYTDSDAWKEANAMKDDARTFATVANVLVPIGVVGLGVGAFLLLRDRPRSTALRVRPSLGGALVEGAF